MNGKLARSARRDALELIRGGFWGAQLAHGGQRICFGLTEVLDDTNRCWIGREQGRAAARPDVDSVIPGRAPESDLVAIVIAVRRLANAVRVRLALGRLQSP